MESHLEHRSLWLAVGVGIAGLILGYTLVISQQESVFAAAQSCPARCHGGDCAQKADCIDGNCTKECDGNCGTQDA